MCGPRDSVEDCHAMRRKQNDLPLFKEALAIAAFDFAFCELMPKFSALDDR